ncbi:MAG: OmpA family protein [Pseudomonadota bacterium]
MRAKLLFIFASLAFVAPAHALDLELPLGARLTAERPSTLDSFAVPLAPFDGAAVPALTLEGAIKRRAWRISTEGLTPLQLMVPLRDQLRQQGFDVVFECDAPACGGFDFRFNTEVLPSPNMYVNVSRFRYLTAVLGDQETPSQAIGVLTSVTARAAYVQVILADTGIDVDSMLPEREQAPLQAPEPPIAAVQDVLADQLTEGLFDHGRVVLSDLVFATGTSDLGQGPFASLEQLASLLRARQDLRIALVGHTDTVGGLDTNIALSRARAHSVRVRLISEYDIAETRLDAEGMGYLAPVASNLTPEGRERNRRVEAILLNVE